VVLHKSSTIEHLVFLRQQAMRVDEVIVGVSQL
jgi:hypothetical protein